jgi:hypothetical protein
MGTSFANLQVHVGSEKSSTLESIAEATADHIADSPYYRRVDDPDDTERTVAVAPAGEWTALYDSRIGHRSLEGLEREAITLSEALDRPVVGTFMHDGEVLELRLARGGELIDRVSSHPTFFGPPEEIYGVESVDALRGSPESWRDAFGDAVDVEALRELWHGDASLEAPDFFEATAEALGWTLDRAGVGYRDLQQQENLEGPIEIRYVGLADWRDWVEFVDGSPAFAPAGSEPPEECAVGEGRKISASIANEGGATEGLVAFAWGPALERDVVEIEQIELAGGRSGGRQTKQPRLQRDEDGTAMAIASFPEIDVGAALVDTDVSGDHPPELERRISEARQSASLSLHVDVQGTSDGDAALNIGVMDPDVPESRGLTTVEVTVLGEPRRPLRARESADLAHALRQMQKSTSLWAIVHFETPSEAWAEEGSEVLADWAEDLAAPKHVFRTYRAGLDETTSEAERPSEGWRGEEIAEQLNEARQFRAHGQLASERSNPLAGTEPGFGFAYYRDVPTSADGDDAGVSGLGFWADLEHRNADAIEHLRERLTSHVDRLAKSEDFLQASMDCWNWTPSSGLERLPYELACDRRWIGDHLEADWLRRWLRAATHTAWLGDELWGRLDGGRVRETADVEALGDVRRLVLRDDADLDDLEDALADILPDADEPSRIES